MFLETKPGKGGRRGARRAIVASLCVLLALTMGCQSSAGGRTFSFAGNRRKTVPPAPPGYKATAERGGKADPFLPPLADASQEAPPAR